MKIRYALLLSVMALTACKQEPAQVDVKGQSSYGRSGSSNNYPDAMRANVPMQTEQAAPAVSIGVSDLSPPSSSNNAPPPAPLAAPAAQSHVLSSPSSVSSSDLAPPPKMEEKAAAPAAVNPWTGKSRYSETQTLDEKPAASAPKAEEAGKTTHNTVSAAAPSGNYIWPVSSQKVLADFGPLGSGKSNDGISIAAASGEPVWAVADGEVTYVGSDVKNFGNMVLVKHTSGLTTTYAHLSKANVDKYARVKQGDILGDVGDSGNVKQPQLYFAVHDGKNAVDPRKYVKN